MSLLYDYSEALRVARWQQKRAADSARWRVIVADIVGYIHSVMLDRRAAADDGARYGGARLRVSADYAARQRCFRAVTMLLSAFVDILSRVISPPLSMMPILFITLSRCAAYAYGAASFTAICCCTLYFASA